MKSSPGTLVSTKENPAQTAGAIAAALGYLICEAEALGLNGVRELIRQALSEAATYIEMAADVRDVI